MIEVSYSPVIHSNVVQSAKFHKVSFDEFYRSYSSPYTNEDDVIEIYNDIELPRRSTIKSAGYDFRIPFDLDCEPGVLYKIPTGVNCEMNPRHVLQLYPRSSLGINYGFRIANTVGVIDADYFGNPTNEGHIFVCFTVDQKCSFEAGDKFCQGVFTMYFATDDDEANLVRTGGIGSTGG